MKALPAPIAKLLNAAAARHGIAEELARAVAWVESRGKTRAVSSAGAQGVMQLMPATAKGLGVKHPFDPVANIDGGVRYLSKLLSEFGDLRKALGAYNWGPGNVRSGRAWPASVEGYVSKVRKRMTAEGAPAAILEDSPRPRPPAPDDDDGGDCAYCKPAAIAVVIGSLAGLTFIGLSLRRARS